MSEYVKECRERVTGEFSNDKGKNKIGSKSEKENIVADERLNDKKDESESESDFEARLRDAAVDLGDSEIERLIDHEGLLMLSDVSSWWYCYDRNRNIMV